MALCKFNSKITTPDSSVFVETCWYSVTYSTEQTACCVLIAKHRGTINSSFCKAESIGAQLALAKSSNGDICLKVPIFFVVSSTKYVLRVNKVCDGKPWIPT